MSIKKIMISGVALLALGLGASIAEAKKAPSAPKDPNAVTTTAKTPKAPKAPKAAKAPKAPKAAKAPPSEKSIACSAEATAKGLHGKARKAYRKACMKKKAA